MLIFARLNTALQQQHDSVMSCCQAVAGLAVARVWGTSCTQTRTELYPQRIFFAPALLPLCRGGMGEALWIRRGTRCPPGVWNNVESAVCSPPLPPSQPGTSICAFSNTRFSLCFLALSALNMRISRPRAYSVRTCPSRRGAFNMHETRPTEAFTVTLRHSTPQCCCG